MTLALLDTLGYVKIIKKAGFNQEQAEAINEAQMSALQTILSEVCTKDDLKILDIATKSDITNLRAEMYAIRDELRAEIAKLRAEMYAIRDELRTEIAASEHRLELKIAELKTELKTFILKAMISIMLTNLTIIGIGFGALAMMLK